jgi:hypothetical protein
VQRLAADVAVHTPNGGCHMDQSEKEGEIVVQLDVRRPLVFELES